MGIQEKRRAADLVNREFNERIRLLERDPSIEEVEKEVESLVKANSLGNMIRELGKAKKTTEIIKKTLSELTVKMRGNKKKTISRYDNCECYEDYEDVLAEIARRNIEKRRCSEKSINEAKSQQRKCLAKIECSENSKDIQQVLKSIGLVD